MLSEQIVKAVDLNSTASQILNIQRYINRNLQELVSITTLNLLKKKKKIV